MGDWSEVFDIFETRCPDGRCWNELCVKEGFWLVGPITRRNPPTWKNQRMPPFNFSVDILAQPEGNATAVSVAGTALGVLYFFIAVFQGALLTSTCFSRQRSSRNNSSNSDEAGSHDMYNSRFVQVSHLLVGFFQGLPLWILMFSSKWTPILCDYSATAIFITFLINIWATCLLAASRYYHIVLRRSINYFWGELWDVWGGYVIWTLKTKSLFLI